MVKGLFSPEKTRSPFGEIQERIARGEVDSGDIQDTDLRIPETRDRDPLEFFENELESETRFIEIENDIKELEIRPEKAPAQLEYEPPVEFQESFEPDVRVPPVKPKTTYKAVGDYYIQVASFSKKENAEKFAEFLRKKLYKVVVEEASVEDKAFFRVRVGPFETKSIATNTMIAMKRRYDIKDPFVLKKNS
jgi:hypothetical protein